MAMNAGEGASRQQLSIAERSRDFVKSHWRGLALTVGGLVGLASQLPIESLLPSVDGNASIPGILEPQKADAAGQTRIFLPVITHDASPTPTPVEVPGLQTVTTFSASETVNGKKITSKALAATDATLQVTVDQSVTTQYMDLVAKYGIPQGITDAKIVVVKAQSEVPPTVKNMFGESSVNDGTGKLVPIGLLGSEKAGTSVIMYFVPSEKLDLSNPSLINGAIDGNTGKSIGGLRRFLYDRFASTISNDGNFVGGEPQDMYDFGTIYNPLQLSARMPASSTSSK